MKYFKILILLLISNTVFAQTKNFIDQAFLETSAKVDTLVTPDRIYLTILISEKDTKGKISVEELENKIADKLKAIGIDLNKQLSLSDLSSNFKIYLLKQQNILKLKSYTLLVYDAKTASSVIVELESENISNISVEKTEYSKIEELKLHLKTKAIEKVKANAVAMITPLNQKIGAVIFISDLNNMSGIIQGRIPGIQVRGMSTLNKTKYEPIEIEFQEIKVEAEVSVKFKIE